MSDDAETPEYVKDILAAFPNATAYRDCWGDWQVEIPLGEIKRETG